MLALMSTANSSYLEIDDDRFMSIMKISGESSVNEGTAHSGKEDDTEKRLQLLRIKGFPRLLPEGILALANYCRYLRELSLSYALLSDELLIALSSEEQLQLETIRLEAHPESKPLPRISENAWFTFCDRLPNINLVLLSYMTNEDDQKYLFMPCIPVTHLYFGEAPSEETVSRVCSHCPRLCELVVAAYISGPLDHALLSVAKGCPRLSALGLGDCEVSCSSLLEFVSICADRLQILYVWETSLIEDGDLDVPKLTAKISMLLGRTWVPEYIPLW